MKLCVTRCVWPQASRDFWPPIQRQETRNKRTYGRSKSCTQPAGATRNLTLCGRPSRNKREREVINGRPQNGEISALAHRNWPAFLLFLFTWARIYFFLFAVPGPRKKERRNGISGQVPVFLCSTPSMTLRSPRSGATRWWGNKESGRVTPWRRVASSDWAVLTMKWPPSHGVYLP